MEENGMSIEQILALVGAILYAINAIGVAIPNRTKYPWLQPILTLCNTLALNFGYNKNAEDK
jgi:hypothetical protein